MKILKIITNYFSSKFITHPSSGADTVNGPCSAVGILLDLISANREDCLIVVSTVRAAWFIENVSVGKVTF